MCVSRGVGVCEQGVVVCEQGVGVCKQGCRRYVWVWVFSCVSHPKTQYTISIIFL